MLRRLIKSYGYAAFVRLADTREFQRVRVALIASEDESSARSWEQLRAAFDLVEAYDPRSLVRVRELADAVLVYDRKGVLGSWMRDERLIILNERWVREDSTDAAHVAATIVHEVTHAWLEHLGFAFVAARRPRIEAICFRAQAAFARRIPSGRELAEYYENRAVAAVTENSEHWTDAAIRARYRERVAEVASELRSLGVPNVLVKALETWGRSRSA